MSPAQRHGPVVAGVVLLHVAALWGLNSGLLRRAIEVVVPVQMLSEFVTAAQPMVEPPPPVPRPQPTPTKAQPVTKAPAPQPAPQPLAHAEAPATAQAPTGSIDPPAPPATVTAPVAPAPAPPARVELPSSDADYLQNPKPAYPSVSKRLGEQGKVLLRVLISTDGRAEQAEIRQSSGYDRLDQAARETVLKWRYVPGKRAGVAEAMWFLVPIHFVLE